MTKAKLIKSSERKNVVIFILIAICFVLAITLSCQNVQIIKNTDLVLENQNKIIANTSEIIGILTIGGQE
jgi:uncharacterized membrane protein YciS (DUF1049 family)